ncbi:MAG: hypothetical protein JW864_10130 [Spirochaetes bacterium]|nr:hypothetical protein [Spirochaetota bacterium]
MSKIENIHRLLNYGWQDSTIASYLMIKKPIVRYYRKKLKINISKYKFFY